MQQQYENEQVLKVRCEGAGEPTGRQPAGAWSDVEREVGRAGVRRKLMPGQPWFLLPVQNAWHPSCITSIPGPTRGRAEPHVYVPAIPRPSVQHIHTCTCVHAHMLQELELLQDDTNVYKLIGPVLVKQVGGLGLRCLRPFDA